MDRRRFMQLSTLATGALGAAAQAAPDTAEPDLVAVVRGVITSWRARDLEGMLRHVDDQIVWHSHVGSPPIRGKAAMREFATKLTEQMAEIHWRIFEAAQAGDCVHVEGVDDYVSKEGRRVVIPYAGVMRFRERLVVEWRDYFDRALFDRLKAGEPLPDYLVALTDRPALF